MIPSLNENPPKSPGQDIRVTRTGDMAVHTLSVAITTTPADRSSPQLTGFVYIPDVEGAIRWICFRFTFFFFESMGLEGIFVTYIDPVILCGM